MRHREWIPRLLFLGLLLLVPLGVVYYRYSSTPDGWYYDKYIGSIEPAYYVFEKGQVHSVLGSLRHNDELLGTYARIGSEWVVSSWGGTGGGIVEPGLLGIKMYDPAPGVIFQYVPRRGFSWLQAGEMLNAGVTPGDHKNASVSMYDVYQQYVTNKDSASKGSVLEK